MQHPTSAQAYAVAQVFEDAIKKYPHAKLDMGEGDVNSFGTVCGTVHCHAGWYAIMKADLSKVITYTTGSLLIASALGFPDDDALSEWALLNRTIWGNKDGRYMFSGEYAFYSIDRPNGAENLQHIADHWREVGGRLEEIENETKK